MSNGNDEDIVSLGGGESITDDANEIHLISKEDYNKLSDTQKQEYLKYTPSMQNEIYTNWVASQKQMINLLTQMESGINKFTPFIKNGSLMSLPIPLQTLLEIVKSVSEMAEAMKEKINAIKSNETLTSIAEPLEVLYQAIGALSALMFALYMNPYQMIETYLKVINEVNLPELDKETNESLKDINKINNDMKQVPIPNMEIKEKLNDCINQSSVLTQNIPPITSTLNDYQSFAENIKNIDLVTQLKDSLTMKNWFTANLDDFIEDNVDLTISPTAESKKWAENVNNATNGLPEKYIKISDIEKLNNLKDY